MSSIVTQRFVKCHNKLKADKTIPSSRQFALSLDYLPQSLSEILKGRRDATIELLRKAVAKYHINPVYLFAGEGPMFMEERPDRGFRLLTVLAGPDKEERILHVPVPAQAGYADHLSDPVFIQSLPAYSLPDERFRSGTHRSFDIVGDSMEPTLYEGDKVICSYLEPDHWSASLKSQLVYVVVTRTEVLVKRVENHIRNYEQIELIADNDYYDSYRVQVAEVREIWQVRAKISPFLPAPRPRRQELAEEVGELRRALHRQDELLQELIRAVHALETQNAES